VLELILQACKTGGSPTEDAILSDSEGFSCSTYCFSRQCLPLGILIRSSKQEITAKWSDSQERTVFFFVVGREAASACSVLALW